MLARLLIALFVALGLLTSRPAQAVDWQDYPEFLHVSGLPGNGFGVDENGQVGFGGAFHQNVPCAYTPAKGNYSASYYAGSVDDRARFTFGGNTVDGTGHIGLGLGKPGHGVYIAEMFVEEHLSVNAFHLQWQVGDESGDRPAIAIGVVDILDQREARHNIPHGARSFYVVATKKVAAGDKPAYVSAGLGDGRFNDRPFGALTWYPSQNLNVGIEYDGRMPRPYAAISMGGRHGYTAALAVGWSDFDRPNLGFMITHSRDAAEASAPPRPTPPQP